MSFQKQRISIEKTPGYASEEGGVVSLINIAANLDDPLYHRTIGKLSIILKELKSINAKRRQHLGGSRALHRYIE
jgi:hypothetical protein